MEEKIIPYKKKNRFTNISNISFEGLKNYYDYYGQVNDDQSPDGIGVAIDIRFGYILEGSFINGNLGYLY